MALNSFRDGRRVFPAISFNHQPDVVDVPAVVANDDLSLGDVGVDGRTDEAIEADHIGVCQEARGNQTLRQAHG